jgi:hypothetical protein
MARTDKPTGDTTVTELTATTTKAPILIDLGRKSRKKIKKLKKGEGALMDDLSATIEQLKLDGVVSEGAQVIVAIVERKPDLDSLYTWEN